MSAEKARRKIKAARRPKSSEHSPMLAAITLRIVSACCRFPWLVIALAGLMGGGAGYYAIENFAINTDTSQLISARLPWRQREVRFNAAFPQHTDTITIVVDGATPELTDRAARSLTADLAKASPNIETVRQPDAGPFFDKNGLLFLSTAEVQHTADQLISAQPFLATLSADPSLRGFAKALAFIPQGVAAGRIEAADFDKPLSAIADAIETSLAGHKGTFSWDELMTGESPKPSDLRRFIIVKPRLDYADLEPGSAASADIRGAARRLGLTKENGVTVRLTGPVALADEEFATVAEGALINGLGTLAVVLVILWLALRSARIILAVVLSLAAGLAVTAALGLALVGAFNLISVAFFVLFVGIGVDFGIQFSVRYRQERHEIGDLESALASAARLAGMPLALAAASTAAGFFAFGPTDYRGVSELGLIAGIGMLVAFATSITVLPALLMILKPPGEAAELGYRSLAPVDRFMARFRWPILALTGLAVLAGLPLLWHLKFDFNPLNLRSAKVESVATMLDLMKDPNTAPNTIDILTPSLEKAKFLARRLDALPEVARTLTLASFVPDDQEKKLAIIADAASLLGPSLDPPETEPEPSAAETTAALTETADAFRAMPERGAGADPISRLATALYKLAAAKPDERARVERTLLSGLKARLGQIRTALTAEKVTRANLPKDLVRDWQTPDGRSRIEVAPKGNANDNVTLERFAAAVLKVAPEATGTPILIQQSADAVVRAFIEAAVLALVSITLILLFVLRRVGDVLVTLIPLLLAAVVTLQLTVLFGLPINFANIIALPLLLGVGVAFKIYYVLAWRGGATSLLASALTRAVLFSAMTTATAFGSLWLSSHPGTSSMGKLLSLALSTTLAAAVLFQPILMGPPRDRD